METVPPVVDHVTELLLNPVTVAVNCCVAPVNSDAELGLIETAPVAEAVTVTVAVADLVVSAMLVAFTVYVPAVLGAVYRPKFEIVPALAVQVTEVFVFPATVAVNC